MVTDIYQKFKHLFEKYLPFVSGLVFNWVIRTRVRIPSPRFGSEKHKENDMSAVVFNATAPQSSINQGFSAVQRLANPSGSTASYALSRRGRLTRTLVVLSLAISMMAGFAARSGAGEQVHSAPSYVNVVVPAGATLWSVASVYSDGDIQAMVEAIREVNNLPGYDVSAGAHLRVPIQ